MGRTESGGVVSKCGGKVGSQNGGGFILSLPRPPPFSPKITTKSLFYSVDVVLSPDNVCRNTMWHWVYAANASRWCERRAQSFPLAAYWHTPYYAQRVALCHIRTRTRTRCSAACSSAAVTLCPYPPLRLSRQHGVWHGRVRRHGPVRTLLGRLRTLPRTYTTYIWYWRRPVGA